MILRPLDWELIKIEEENTGFKFKRIEINEYDIDCIFKDFDCIEYTIHYYDSDAPECKSCNKDTCRECQYYIKYDKSKRQLSFNNWIDVIAPGVFDETQEEVNNQAKDYLLYIVKESRKNNIHQFFIVQNENPEEKFILYLYYRNIDRNDNYFIFKRK